MKGRVKDLEHLVRNYLCQMEISLKEERLGDFKRYAHKASEYINLLKSNKFDIKKYSNKYKSLNNAYKAAIKKSSIK